MSLEHVEQEERLEELGSSNEGRERFERGGANYIIYFLKSLVVKMGPNSSEVHREGTRHKENRFQ